MKMPKLRFKADDGSDFPDWEKITLGELGHVAMCKRVYKYQTNTDGDIPFFKIGTFGSIPDAYISRDLFNELKTKYSYPQKGTVLLSASGTIGRSVVFDGKDAYFQDSNIVWLEHDNTVLDSYLSQFYQVVEWKGLEGSTIKRLYNKIILNTTFYRPCIAEQHKIADLLLTVDTIIEKQQAEIKAWEQYKKGVAQKLFSQEVRFKADDGSDFPNWECKTLGELGTFYGGLSGKSKEDFVDGTCPYITYKNVYLNTFATPISDDKVKIKPQERQNKVKQFDVLFTQSSETFEEVGLSSVYLYDDEPYLNSFCKGFRFNNLEQIYPKFIGHLLRSDNVRHDIILMGQGISRINLRTQYLSKLNFKLPSQAEQRKIAECLDAIDDVIALAKAELEKWRELKKGLLQQLFV